MKDDCIFCKLANGVFKTNTIYEDDYFRVILDASPSNQGHALILPKEHFDNIYELNDEYSSKLMPVANKVSKAMRDLLKCDGLNILQNNGEVAGQTVFHFHMHLIPRYNDDSVNINWTPGSVDDDFAKDYVAKMKGRFSE